jgi:hypothetical protein
MPLFDYSLPTETSIEEKGLTAKEPQEEMNGDVSPFRADTSHSAPLASDRQSNGHGKSILHCSSPVKGIVLPNFASSAFTPRTVDWMVESQKG